MPFALKKQAAVLAHVNFRDEHHGDDLVLAADLKIKADVHNLLLNDLAPGLLASLYSAEDPQAELVEGHLPTIRYPLLDGLVFTTKMVDANFVIHGAKKADDIEFKAKIKEVALDCKEGGTVAIMFKAQVLPEPDQAGLLPSLLGQKVKVSVSGGTTAVDDLSEEETTD